MTDILAETARRRARSMRSGKQLYDERLYEDLAAHIEALIAERDAALLAGVKAGIEAAENAVGGVKFTRRDGGLHPANAVCMLDPIQIAKEARDAN
jgi:hypothetical protein